MKKCFAMFVMVGLVSGLSLNAFAHKQLNDKFLEIYGSPESNETSPAFKVMAKEAKCNVCHILGENKKKRNPFGAVLHDEIEAGKFPLKEFIVDLKKDTESTKYDDALKAIFKKVVEQKAGTTDKTFAERMKADELPGGDKEGKGLPAAAK